MRAGGHKISRATVYRNLDLLVAAGLVHKVRLGGNRSVFEHVHPGQKHDHLACRRCGRMVEFVSPAIAAMLAEICRAHGFARQGNQLQILGECVGCADRPAPEAAGLAPEAAGRGARWLNRAPAPRPSTWSRSPSSRPGESRACTAATWRRARPACSRRWG